MNYVQIINQITKMLRIKPEKYLIEAHMEAIKAIEKAEREEMQPMINEIARRMARDLKIKWRL